VDRAIKGWRSPQRPKEEKRSMPKKRKRIAKATLMLAVVFLALVAGSGGTAFAQIGSVIQCQGIPCVATGDHQVLFEQVGDGVRDRMIAQAGYDHLNAQTYTNDRDVTKGGGDHDVLLVNDGDAMDAAIGGPGYDLCVVDAHIEASDTCESVAYPSPPVRP
jgi:hypothetical protein